MTLSEVRHPKGVLSIAFTQMWESFSFFGMRALLVLYLVTQAGFSYPDAFILYALYIAFVKIFAVLGGYVVDRFLGYQRAVLIGGICIFAGHLLLTLSLNSSLFFLSLGCIVCGSAIFRVSLQALLGLVYEKEDFRREKGFTLLYVGMNLGGLLAAVLCGLAANFYGWHVGFGLAAIGMLLGLVFFASQRKIFASLETKKTLSFKVIFPVCCLGAISIGFLLSQFKVMQSCSLLLGGIALGGILMVLSKKVNKRLLLSLVGSFLLLIVFFTAEELWGSLLMVFSENHIERSLFGLEIPSAAIAAMNPLTIILLGPLFVKKQIRRGAKLALAFLLLAVAFFILYFTSLMTQPSFLYLLAGLGSIALGELFLAPTLLAFASESAPKESVGMMMGATALALSMGSLLSGEVSKISLEPGQTFLGIGICAFVIFILLVGGGLFKESKRVLIPKHGDSV